MINRAAKFKEWEMPVSPVYGFQTMLPNLVGQLSFDSVKDYDDYIERLKKVPVAFSQVMTNMQLGVDEGRMPPKDSLEEALKQTQNIAAQKPEESVFAQPLKKFPKAIPRGGSEAHRDGPDDGNPDAGAADVSEVREIYGRAICAEREERSRRVGDARRRCLLRVSDSPDHDTDKTAAEIHQIGLDEVKRDEAEMLAIVHQLGFADLKSFRAALVANPKEHPQSKEALLDTYKGYIAQMQPRLPELFGRLPKAKLEVVDDADVR